MYFIFMILKSLRVLPVFRLKPSRREMLAAFFLGKKFGSQIIKNYICSCITAVFKNIKAKQYETVPARIPA